MDTVFPMRFRVVAILRRERVWAAVFADGPLKTPSKRRKERCASNPHANGMASRIFPGCVDGEISQGPLLSSKAFGQP